MVSCMYADSSDDILRDSKSCDSTESSWSLDDFSTSYGEIGIY